MFTGTLNDTRSQDLAYLVLSEAPTLGYSLDARFSFYDVPITDGLNVWFYGYWNAARDIKIYIWDWVASGWKVLTSQSTDMAQSQAAPAWYRYNLPVDARYASGSGEVILQWATAIGGSTANRLYLDYLELVADISSSSTSSTSSISSSSSSSSESNQTSQSSSSSSSVSSGTVLFFQGAVVLECDGVATVSSVGGTTVITINPY